MNEPHVTQELLKDFQAGKLTRAEEANLFQHVAACDHCSGLFADSFDEEPLLMAPRDLETRIMKSSQSLNTQAVVTVRHYSKQMQLALYSLKVGAAVAASLLLLAATPMPMDPMSLPPDGYYETQTGITGWFEQKSNHLGEWLSHFSNQIPNMEENNYD